MADALTGRQGLQLAFSTWEETITVPYGVTVTGWPGPAFGGTLIVASVERQDCEANEVCAASQATPAKLRAVFAVEHSVETFQPSPQRS